MTNAWARLPQPWELKDGEVHVVYASLAASDRGVARCASLLSSDEAERARRFYFEEHRRRFTVGRGVLRLLLGQLVPTPPAALRFVTTEKGKPLLVPDQRAGIEFNVSHSADEALFAFARNRVVGVDVECIRPIEYHQLARHSFSQTEQQVLRSLPDDLVPLGFFTCWSQKEAYIKARGDGLSFPLHAFDVDLIPDHPPRLLANRLEPEDIARWTMHALPDVPQARNALCVEGTPTAIRSYAFRLE